MTLHYWMDTTPQRDRVWLQASDGSTVGRFGRMGIDLHNTITEQLAGLPECRLCTHGQTTPEDWQLFREKALEWWGIDVPDNAISKDILGAASAAKF